MIKLKDYQTKAVADMATHFKALEAEHHHAKAPKFTTRRIVLEMPTGMGKTHTIGNFLATHVVSTNFVLLFSPGAGNLADQTFRSLQTWLPGKVAMLDESTVGAGNVPSVDSVLVANWETLVMRSKTTGNYKNKLTRETERQGFFDFMRQAQVPVTVVIDEAHFGKSGAADAIKSFMEDLTRALRYSPIIIEASATPILDESGAFHEHIEVSINDGRKAGLIRSSVIMNDGVKDVLTKLKAEQRPTADLRRTLLMAAYEKQKMLHARYIHHGIHQVPLIGIQVPNGRDGNEVIALAKEFFAEFSITEANGSLAVYMTAEKSAHLATLSEDTSPVRVLIYKMAVTTGFDCPRAQICVGFRDIRTRIFSVQNRGRYYRTWKGQYFPDATLNAAYFYSDEEDFIKGVEDEGDKKGGYEWSSVMLKAVPKRLAEISALSLPTSWIKRTKRNVLDKKALRTVLPIYTHLLTDYFKPLSEEKIKFHSFREAEISTAEGATVAYGDTVTLSEAANKRKVSFQKTMQAAIEKVNHYGNNQRASEEIERLLTISLRQSSSLRAAYDVHDAKKVRNISFTDFVYEQFTSYREGDMRLGAARTELNHNVEVLNAFIEAMLTDERAPRPRMTQAEAEAKKIEVDSVDLREKYDWDYSNFNVGDYQEVKERSAKGTNQVTGSRASMRLYQAEDGSTYVEGLSGPESKFETYLTDMILSRTDLDETESWFEKNGTHVGALGFAFRDGYSANTMYPDYYGVIVHTDGTRVPFVYEVKDTDAAGAAGHRDAKAESIVQYADKLGIAGGMIHFKDGEWRTIRKDEQNSELLDTLIGSKSIRKSVLDRPDWMREIGISSEETLDRESDIC